MAHALDIGTKFHMQGDSMVVQRFQDCTAIHELCKSKNKEGVHGSSDMRLAASLPFVVVENYCNQNGVEFAEVMAPGSPHIKRMLNDPALAGFRIWEGRV